MPAKGQFAILCKRGHDLSGDNARIYVAKNGHVHHRCRVCARLQSRKDYISNKHRTGPKSPRTHCRNGHLLSTGNVRRRKGGWKECRTCYRDSHLKRTFGISHEQFQQMLAKQSGRCANTGCLASDSGAGGAFRVDHDHTTGMVRALLCHRCNVSLGLLGENCAVISGLLNYLNTHREA